MLKNTARRWGSMAKTLHWVIALLILLEVPAGFLMSYTYRMSLHDKDGLALHTLLSQIHHTNGFLILLLAAIRLSWRTSQAVPEDRSRFRAQFWLSRITHFGLYTLLIAMPLSGWLALSRFGKAPIWTFGYSGVVPMIAPTVPFNAPYGYGFFAGIHVWGYKVGAGLLTIHIAAALWHHFVAGDMVLVRMWPLGRLQSEEASP